MEKPQIVLHSQKSVNYTTFDIKWIPQSPRYIAIGQLANSSGIIEIHSLQGSIQKISRPEAFKCMTFNATADNSLVTGDFHGGIKVWDLEKSKTTLNFNGHDQIINSMDGCGGQSITSGPPELVTASRDGFVKIWDFRQGQEPVAILGPDEGERVVDPWTVCFGDSYDDQNRSVAIGYENGDIKLFDLKTMSIRYETNLKNGICSLEFDRRDIKMNKLVATGLESKFHLFDMRTFHPEKGYTSMSQKQNTTNTTGWLVKHLPQNRDLFMTSFGAGELQLFKYHYPASRVVKGDDDKEIGVTGRVESLQTATLAEQPIASFDWSPDKTGLFCFAGFDQQIKVGMVTRLSGY